MTERRRSQPRILIWFSCGASSAVVTKWVLTKHSKAIPIYCDTMVTEHEDNRRFMADCEKWFGRPVRRLRSEKYKDTWDVWERSKYLSGVKGAPCTRELKVIPRLKFQRPTDMHVFGYTADNDDMRRADALRESWPELKTWTPLIEHGITKKACLGLIARAGIKVPAAYALGFSHNNCIPCVKAASPAYWALVRKIRPDQFARMVELSRRLDVRLCVIKGERRFIDEIPLDHPTSGADQPACDFLCQMFERELQELSV